jgi:hypothetical protein
MHEQGNDPAVIRTLLQQRSGGMPPVTLSYIAASRMSANRNNAAVDLRLSYVGNGQQAAG